MPLEEALSPTQTSTSEFIAALPTSHPVPTFQAASHLNVQARGDIKNQLGRGKHSVKNVQNTKKQSEWIHQVIEESPKCEKLLKFSSVQSGIGFL